MYLQNVCWKDLLTLLVWRESQSDPGTLGADVDSQCCQDTWHSWLTCEQRHCVDCCSYCCGANDIGQAAYLIRLQVLKVVECASAGTLVGSSAHCGMFLVLCHTISQWRSNVFQCQKNEKHLLTSCSIALEHKNCARLCMTIFTNLQVVQQS